MEGSPIKETRGLEATPVFEMVRSATLTFLLAVSTVLVVSRPNVLLPPKLPWDSDWRQKPPPFPPEPPPEFKGILPPEIFAKLTAIHQDQSLTIPQKIVKIEEIMNSLPEDVLQRLPLPPVFRLLPQNVQEMIKTVRTTKNLTMEEKWLQMIILIESLPKQQHRLLQQMLPKFSLGPLPDFQDIIPKEDWDKLTAVYQDTNLDNIEKLRRVDEIIDALPDSIRQKIPLSPPFQKLPDHIQQQLQIIHTERGLTTEQRFRKMKAIIESLPWDMKKLMFQP
uniref:SXP/RAL-2 family protein Ani s 5-like cation-binding domain-containing protein n=1 Tax=Onchocerca volvulus TaxID=6282 RepID=A0A2K6WAG1_ONCVO